MTDPIVYQIDCKLGCGKRLADAIRYGLRVTVEELPGMNGWQSDRVQFQAPKDVDLDFLRPAWLPPRD